MPQVASSPSGISFSVTGGPGTGFLPSANALRMSTAFQLAYFCFSWICFHYNPSAQADSIERHTTEQIIAPVCNNSGVHKLYENLILRAWPYSDITSIAIIWNARELITIQDWEELLEMTYVRWQFTKLKQDLEEDTRRIKSHGSLPVKQNNKKSITRITSLHAG